MGRVTAFSLTFLLSLSAFAGTPEPLLVDQSFNTRVIKNVGDVEVTLTVESVTGRALKSCWGAFQSVDERIWMRAVCSLRHLGGDRYVAKLSYFFAAPTASQIYKVSSLSLSSAGTWADEILDLDEARMEFQVFGDETLTPIALDSIDYKADKSVGLDTPIVITVNTDSITDLTQLSLGLDVTGCKGSRSISSSIELLGGINAKVVRKGSKVSVTRTWTLREFVKGSLAKDWAERGCKEFALGKLVRVQNRSLQDSREQWNETKFTIVH